MARRLKGEELIGRTMGWTEREYDSQKPFTVGCLCGRRFNSKRWVDEAEYQCPCGRVWRIRRLYCTEMYP